MNRIWAWPQSRRTYRPPSVRPLSGGRSKLSRSEEHTSELQSQSNLVCRLLLEKKKHPLHLALLGCVYRRWTPQQSLYGQCPRRHRRALAISIVTPHLVNGLCSAQNVPPPPSVP